MQTTINLFSIITLLGAALMAGTFFAFSSFVMQSLDRLTSANAINVMQQINIVVINPWFLGAFVGTALLSCALFVLVWLHMPASAYWLLAASAAYFLGTFLLTVLGNIPLNNRLAEMAPDDPQAEAVWLIYRRQWTRWNHLRCFFALLATLLIALSLAR